MPSAALGVAQKAIASNLHVAGQRPARAWRGQHMDRSSRRDVLKIALIVGGAAALPLRARADGKAITLLHESSFIKVYDEFFQNTLAPAYEKETGVKVTYELTSVGSLPTRDSTVIETGSGADVTA